MTDPIASITPKWWANSLTVRGALLSAASAALPIVGVLTGFDLSGETISQVSNQVVTVVQAVGGLAGMVMTVIGRSRARQPITRKRVGVLI